MECLGGGGVIWSCGRTCFFFVFLCGRAQGQEREESKGKKRINKNVGKRTGKDLEGWGGGEDSDAEGVNQTWSGNGDDGGNGSPAV